jgi:hypothetical protein
MMHFPIAAGREKRPIKSLVTGRPILLALEDIDGSPSFLEKALRFLEKHGGGQNRSFLVPESFSVARLITLTWILIDYVNLQLQG